MLVEEIAEPAVEETAPERGAGPYIPAGTIIPEINFRGLAVGSLLGIFFAASSVYLALKVGITVSASIPIAVLSITLFRGLARAFRLRPATILENNIVQTAGSAGESVAAGVAFTLPALLLLGFHLEMERVLLVALLGGLLGILMMIPLRRGLIESKAGETTLTYPEGRAAADVLIAGDQGGTSARRVFQGFFVGLGYAVCNLIFKVWSETASFAMEFWGRYRGGLLSIEVSPPLLGVGYIIGLRTAANMMAGGTLAYLVLVPLAHLFGETLTTPLYPATKLISAMTATEIRGSYILYIGAGAVAAGGLLALVRAVPTIFSSFADGFARLRGGGTGSAKELRTDRDLPLTVVLGGSLVLALAIWLAPGLGINGTTASLIVLCAFFFVTVSSRVTGELGSSANPISGMTVACLLLTCGLFALAGWTGSSYQVMALTSAAVLCVAISNGGTTSQDLKTGSLVGATPRHQQVAILVGVVTSALVIGATLLLLDRGNTTYMPVDIPNVTVSVPAGAAAEKGPDGASYRVVALSEDQGAAHRGRYLADATGRLAFRIDPGVAGTFPFRLERLASTAQLQVPPAAPIELGLDRKPYRAVELAAPQGGLAAGHYLVGEGGQPVWAARPAAKFDAPKAQLFALIIEGMLGGKLPWGLVLAGVFLALLVELLGVDALPFAVGLYLPISTSAAIFGGGIVRWLVDRKAKSGAAASETGPGLLMASGLIAGGAIAGVLQAVLTSRGADNAFDLGAFLGPWARNGSWWPLIPFLILAVLLYRVAVKRPAAEV
jgi:putative OPT family oligopeptide transporter